jgi:hypothetical protein
VIEFDTIYVCAVNVPATDKLPLITPLPVTFKFVPSNVIPD